MTTYAIVDLSNLFSRARHVTQGDAFIKAGMALLITFRSLRRLHREFKVDHMVFAVDNGSWRYAVHPGYKSRRKLERSAATPEEKEEAEILYQTLDNLITYLTEKTRCTVLNTKGIEADDFVARWVQLHPDDEHWIVSGDSDFVQLLAPNVHIYDGLEDRILRIDGVFDQKGQPLEFSVRKENGKIKVGPTLAEAKKKHDAAQREKEKAHNAAEKQRAQAHAEAEKAKQQANPGYKPTRYVATPYEWVEYSFEPEPEWWRKALFIKIIRGDEGDSIFSAYPGVRYDGSSKKVGIKQAWEDRRERGFHWNNFFLAEWEKLLHVDPDGTKHTKMVRVIDEFRFNETLIDLTKQPDEIKAKMDEAIVEACSREKATGVGIHFLRFCEQHDLPSLAREAHDHAAYLNAPYSR